jgi:hypothetical protein
VGKEHDMQITLEIPDDVVREAKAVAQRTGQDIEVILATWLDKMAAELPVESLSDERILELCDLQMTDKQQSELSDLLARNRESQLHPDELARLEALMQIYRRGMVRKAEALKVAVQRGLRPPLT